MTTCGDLRAKSKIISDCSKLVKLDYSKIDRFCNNFDPSKLKHWLSDSPFQLTSIPTDEEKLAFLTVFNSLSFSYWGSPKWRVNFSGYIIDGTWAMLACLGRSVTSGVISLDANKLAELPEITFKEILAGSVEIPLLYERLQNIRDIGQVIANRYGGKFTNFVEESKFDAQLMLSRLTSDFSSFSDVSNYNDLTVGFYKRAQLLVSDICNSFQHSRRLNVRGLETLTACADYKLPQVLRYYEILDYSRELIDSIVMGNELSSGSPEEVEIRANTIHAVELIKERLQNNLIFVTASQINDLLWLEGQTKLPNDEPYHRTRTTAY